MQNFYYNYIKNKYVAQADILLTDTDTLFFIIETENVYEDFYKDKEFFDFSNYPKEWKYHDNLNKLAIGVQCFHKKISRIKI